MKVKRNFIYSGFGSWLFIWFLLLVHAGLTFVFILPPSGMKAWHSGQAYFCGIVGYEFEFSVIVFVFLYALYYFLAVRFLLSDLFVKSVIFNFLLIGVFIANYLDNPGIWFHPFYMAYAVAALSGHLYV